MGKKYRHFTNEDMQMNNNYMNRCSSSLIIRKLTVNSILKP